MNKPSDYTAYCFNQIEGLLLSSIDDLCYRMDHNGAPRDPVEASVNNVKTMSDLAARIKLQASVYRERIIKNRFRLAPPSRQVEEIFIDPHRPPAGDVDYVSRIHGLLKQGKVIRRSEYDEYRRILDNYPKWRRHADFPKPDQITDFIVSDSENIDESRRPPWMPSREDERIVLDTIKALVRDGFVRAAEADRYEEIMSKHPDFAKSYPARVRGSEARRYLRLRDGTALDRAIKRKRK